MRSLKVKFTNPISADSPPVRFNVSSSDPRLILPRDDVLILKGGASVDLFVTVPKQSVPGLQEAIVTIRKGDKYDTPGSTMSILVLFKITVQSAQRNQ